MFKIFLALVLTSGAALAQGQVTPQPPSTEVILPWGAWLVAFANVLVHTVLIPLALGATSAFLIKLSPWAKLFISERLVERAVRNAADYALNAIDGAAKDQKLSASVGSVVIAAAVQRGIDQFPSWLMEAAGGPTGFAEKVFRVLNLSPEANASNTLAPVISRQ